MIKINIAGDFFLNGDSNVNISKRTIEFFNNSDLNLFNLEAPVQFKKKLDNKITKVGPNLKIDSSSIKPFIKKLNIGGFTLANNHILDYGLEGLQSTRQFLNENSIVEFGLLNSANEIIRINEINIAIINICENEYSTINNKVNGLDLIKVHREIKNIKDKCDHIIVIYHGGNEYLEIPSPNQINKFKFFVDIGADVVVSHHSHKISGFEIYNNKPIFYGLGNFLFQSDNTSNYWNRGMVVNLNISKSKIDYKLNFIKNKNGKLEILDNASSDYQSIYNEVISINKIILNEKLYSTAWNKYLVKKKEDYIKIISPVNSIDNKYVRKIIRNLEDFKILKFTRFYLTMLNLFRCESHKEISEETLKYIYENRNS